MGVVRGITRWVVFLSLSVPFCFVGRHAAFAPRFAKSRVVPWELGKQVYVDDPTLIAAGSREDM